MTREEIKRDARKASIAICSIRLEPYEVGMQQVIALTIEEAVFAERARNAETAWVMQQESFGGGTAIGNQIADGIDRKRS